jgi:hypothetical protein
MRLSALLALLGIVCTGCGILPGGESGGLWSLLPTSDLGIAGTPAFPSLGTSETRVFLARQTIQGLVRDQYGGGMPGVVVCYGTGEEDGSPVAETDSQGEYSVSLPPNTEGGVYLLRAYLPLYRFEPDRV